MQLTSALLASLLAASSMASAPLPYFKQHGGSISHSYKHHTPGATPSFKHHSPSGRPHHHTPSPVLPDPIASILSELPVEALDKRDQWRHGHSSPSWVSPSFATPTPHHHHTSKKHHSTKKHHSSGAAHPTGRVEKRDAEWKHHHKSGAAQPTGHHHHHESPSKGHHAPTPSGYGYMFKRGEPMEWSQHRHSRGSAHGTGSWPAGAPKPTGKPHHHSHSKDAATKTDDWESTAYWNQPEASSSFNRSWGRPAPPTSTLSFKTAVKKHYYPSGAAEPTGHHHAHHTPGASPTRHHHHTPTAKPTSWWWW